MKTMLWLVYAFVIRVYTHHNYRILVQSMSKCTCMKNRQFIQRLVLSLIL